MSGRRIEEGTPDILWSVRPLVLLPLAVRAPRRPVVSNPRRPHQANKESQPPFFSAEQRLLDKRNGRKRGRRSEKERRPCLSCDGWPATRWPPGNAGEALCTTVTSVVGNEARTAGELAEAGPRSRTAGEAAGADGAGLTVGRSVRRRRRQRRQTGHGGARTAVERTRRGGGEALARGGRG
jgi:hypothetical protein